MQNYVNLYKKWLHFETVTIKRKWFWQKDETKILYNEEFYSEAEFYDSKTVLFHLMNRIENTGYDIGIFYDEVRIEPNFRHQGYIPPINVRVDRLDCKNNTYSKHEALFIALEKFSLKFESYVLKG